MNEKALQRAFRFLRLLPLYFIFITTFGFAAWDKWGGGSVPEWFQKQFMDTILNPFPGALAANFYMLALLESLVVLGMLASLVRGEFLPGRPKGILQLSLLLGALIFGMLSFGQRVTKNWAEGATLFFFFSGTLISILFVEKESVARDS